MESNITHNGTNYGITFKFAFFFQLKWHKNDAPGLFSKSL